MADVLVGSAGASAVARPRSYAGVDAGLPRGGHWWRRLDWPARVWRDAGISQLLRQLLVRLNTCSRCTLSRRHLVWPGRYPALLALCLTFCLDVPDREVLLELEARHATSTRTLSRRGFAACCAGLGLPDGVDPDQVFAELVARGSSGNQQVGFDEFCCWAGTVAGFEVSFKQPQQQQQQPKQPRPGQADRAPAIGAGATALGAAAARALEKTLSNNTERSSPDRFHAAARWAEQVGGGQGEDDPPSPPAHETIISPTVSPSSPAQQVCRTPQQPVLAATSTRSTAGVRLKSFARAGGRAVGERSEPRGVGWLLVVGPEPPRAARARALGCEPAGPGHSDRAAAA